MISNPTSSESDALEHMFSGNNYHVTEFRNLIDRSIDDLQTTMISQNDPNEMFRLSGAMIALIELQKIINK